MPAYASKKKLGRQKWAKAAGDHETVSARTDPRTGGYLEDLNFESTESIRFHPSKTPGKRQQSVRPSCCAAEEELPMLSGEMEFTTGKAEIGYDDKKHQTVFSFMRHQTDSQGREVQENKARVRNIQGQEKVRSNDEDFAQGAVGLRCEAARSPKEVMRRMGTFSAREDRDTTMDRVLPFQRTDKERAKVKELQEMEHDNADDRTSIHSAASSAAAFAQKKRQKQMDFRKKFAKAVNENKKEATAKDDYLLYIKKKWEAMLEENPLFTLLGGTLGAAAAAQLLLGSESGDMTDQLVTEEPVQDIPEQVTQDVPQQVPEASADAEEQDDAGGPPEDPPEDPSKNRGKGPSRPPRQNGFDT